MPSLMPRKPVPDVAVPLVGGGQWRLSEEKPSNFSMVVFYRGLHCPICARQLAEIESKLDELSARGISAVAISTDNAERAGKSKADWKLPRLRVGYGLDIDTARKWGLYVSASIRPTEPAEFSEPGLFLVRPDMTLYYGSVATMPFARPPLADLMMGIDYAIKNNYPARGES